MEARLAEWARRSGPDFRDSDCVRFALDLVSAQLGFDVRRELGLPAWTDERGALNAVRTYAGTLAGCAAKAARRLGLQPVRLDEAETGALGIAGQRSVFGSTLCVLGPERVWQTFTAPEGLTDVDAAALVQAWRV